MSNNELVGILLPRGNCPPKVNKWVNRGLVVKVTKMPTLCNSVGAGDTHSSERKSRADYKHSPNTPQSQRGARKHPVWSLPKHVLETQYTCGKRLVRSKESKRELFRAGIKRHVWQKPNTDEDPENTMAIGKHGGGSITLPLCTSLRRNPNEIRFRSWLWRHKMEKSLLKSGK